MFTNIMVPLDGSERAEKALPYARNLATNSGGTIHLTYVIEPPSAVRMAGVGAPVNVYEPVIAAQREEAMTYMDGVRGRLEGDGLQVRPVELLGRDEAATLLEYAEQTGIDVVVMTTHGRSGLTRWALGSVADRVAHGGIVPVLLVPVQSAGRTDET